MEAYEILFFTGLSLCLIALLLLVTIQLGMARKFGVYGSSFKSLDVSQKKKAKISGYLFLSGVSIIIIGFMVRDAL